MTSPQHVIIVGSGISAIMTALTLTKAGHAITLVSKTPDPRTTTSYAVDESATWGGEMTRCITPYESHSFLGQSPLHPQLDKAFNSPLQHHGWLTRDIAEYTSHEQTWLKERQHHINNPTSHDQATNYHQEQNKQSIALWHKWRKHYPSLFDHTQIHDSILDIYETTEQFTYAKGLHTQNGTLIDSITGKDVISSHPFLAKAIQENHVYGLLKIKGFSIDIQQFIKNSLDHIEINKHNNLQFNTTITKLLTNEQNHITGLGATNDSQQPITLTADHYTLHVGAYDSENLLQHTPAAHKIHGVIGRWLRLPLHPNDNITHSMKCHITAPDHANHMNLALWQDIKGKSWLLCGAGHAHIGEHRSYFTDTHRQIMDQRNHNAVKRLLPYLYKRALSEGSFIHSDRECSRAWTSNDLPIQEPIKTQAGGKLIITGGSITGTTSLAASESKSIEKMIRKS